MGNKNVVTKQYIADNEKFADLFNYYIYNGARIIAPEQLKEKDPTELLSIIDQEQKTYAKEKLRDVLKECVVKQSGETLYILMGVELQSAVHYAMPIRNGLYDFIDYASQVQKKAKEHREKKDLSSGEFLSGFGKCDKIKPVITLVVYFNEGEWDGPRSLHDMMDVDDKNLLQYVSDYKLNILVPKEVEHPEWFQTDLRYIMEYLKVADNKERLRALLAENRVFSEFGKDAAMVLKECIGATFEETEKEGKVNMCTAYQQMVEEGRAEGSSEQMALDTKIIIAVNAGKSIEDIVSELHVSEENVREIAAAMQRS